MHQYLRRVPATSQTGLVFLFALCALACDTGKPDPPPAAAGDSTPAVSDAGFVVMSFNIRFGTADDGPNRWEMRRGHVFDVIRKYGPDIIGVQEALRFQLDELKTALPQYDEFGVGRDDGKQGGEHAAILFNRDRYERIGGGTFWLSDTPDVVCSTSWGNTLCRICTWAQFRERESGRVFFHYNLHLDHQSAESRLQSVKLVIDVIDRRSPAAPVILTGDFNANESSSPIAAIAEARVAAVDNSGIAHRAAFVDTFRKVHADSTHVGTFGDWIGRIDGPKIDYIFVVENGFDVMRSEIAHDRFNGAFPSDHYPVWATLRFHVNSAGSGRAD